MATTPNAFSSPRVDINTISKLNLLRVDNAEGWVKEFPELALNNYFMSITALPNVMRWTPQQTFRTWLDRNKPLPSATVLEAATGAAGAAVEVQLSAGSYTGSDSSLSPFSVGQIWEDNVTAIRYEVMAVNKAVDGAHTVSLKPVKSSVGANLAEGAFLKWQGYASVREASTKNPGIYREFEKGEGTVNIMRHDKEYTDLAMFERTDIDGRTYDMIQDQYFDNDMVATIEQQHIFGTDMDNLSAPSNRAGKAKGLIQLVKESSGTYVGPNAGDIDRDYFEGLALKQKANGGSNEFQGLLGPLYEIAWQNAMIDQMGFNGAIVYGSFNGNKELALSLNFSSYSIYGQTYHINPYNWFNAALTHGADLGAGYYDDAALFIPQGTVQFPDASLGYSSARKLSVRYMSREEGGQIIRRVQDGGLINPNGSTSMHAEVGLVTYQGLEAYALNEYAFTKLGLT